MRDEENEPMDALDRLIADAARDYHTPPATVPRDDMWAAIVAARGEGSLPRAERGVVSLAEARAERAERAERQARRRGLLAVAAAAAVFLATGLGVGRWWGRGEVATTSAPQSSQVASAPPVTATPTPAAPSIDSADASAPAPDRERVERVASAPREEERTDERTVRRALPSEPARANGGDTYDVAVLRHFAQAEALLVSYRADTVDPAMDRRLSAWARPLLADTRLLLDSPAASDPRRRRLLEDLELVLAQVARLAPSVASDSATRERGERTLIDGSMRRAQILPRLRTLAPSGA